MTIFIIALAAFAFTYLGAYFAHRIKGNKHNLISFSAGAILTVALFDLVPESFEALKDFKALSLWMIAGFTVYFLLNNYLAMTAHTDDDVCHNDSHSHHHNFNIYGLALHSLLDGLAIGFSYQASPSLGVAVAIGILAHRFSDGVNSVALSVKNHRDSWKWIHLNATAPVFGIFIGLYTAVPVNVLGYILAFSAGLFLYISASDLVPECHHDHPKWMTSASFISGILVLLLILNFGHTHVHPEETHNPNVESLDAHHGHNH
jgi:ZIP family zinc transporter